MTDIPDIDAKKAAALTDQAREVDLIDALKAIEAAARRGLNFVNYPFSMDPAVLDNGGRVFVIMNLNSRGFQVKQQPHNIIDIGW